MTRKLIGLIAFISTGAGLLVSTLIRNKNPINTGFLILVGCLITISLVDHFNELKN